MQLRKSLASVIVLLGVIGIGFCIKEQVPEYALDNLSKSYALNDKILRMDPLLAHRGYTLNFVQFKGEIKPHYHKKHEEIVFALTEGGHIVIDSVTYSFRQGSLYWIDKGMVHSAFCQEGVTCRVYSIFFPEWNPKKPDRIWVNP